MNGGITLVTKEMTKNDLATIIKMILYELGIESDVNQKKNDMLFVDYLEQWLSNYQNQIEPNTFQAYQTQLKNHIIPYFTEQNLKLRELKAFHIQQYYSFKLNEKLSPNSVIRHHALIHRALKFAVKSGLISTNIADQVERPRIQKYYGAFYNQNELKILFEKVKGTSIELGVYITANYGLRRSELLGLKWNAIDWENKQIKIMHKVVQYMETDENGKKYKRVLCKSKMKNDSSYRSLPLLPSIEKMLLDEREEQRENKKKTKHYDDSYSEYIFVNSKGKLITPDYFTRKFAQVLQQNNLKKIRFHDLRHSCASLLINLGFSMKEIQEWLGHASFKTTADIYGHVDSKSKVKMAEKLGMVLT